MRTLRIDDQVVSDDSDCFVIAELGHKHQGSLDRAIELIDASRYVTGSNPVADGGWTA